MQSLHDVHPRHRGRPPAEARCAARSLLALLRVTLPSEPASHPPEATSRAHAGPRRILALTTLEPECQPGVEHIGAFAAALGAQLVLAHALASPSAGPDGHLSGVADAERELLRMRLQLGQRHPGLDAGSRVRDNRRHGWLGEEIGRARADWLAMVTRRGGYARHGALRASREALGDSSVPVLLVDDEASSRDLGPGCIVAVAYDFGPTSEDALQHALVIARRLRAQVRLVFVYPGAFELDLHPASERLADVASAAQAALRSLIVDRKDDEVEIDFRVRFGRAARELADEARACEAALLVVGRHAGHGAHRFTSTLAEELLRIAPCALLILPASRGPG